MLQNMREGAGKWLIWAVIIVVIIALSLWGISYYFMDGNAATPPVAKVNGEKITQQDLSDAYNRLRQAQPKLFTQPGAAQKIKNELLEQLINQSILSQAATDNGFAISQAQLNSYLTTIPAFQINGQFSQNQFNLILNRLMYTPDQFMQEMRGQLLNNQVQNGIAASTFALPAESERFIALLQQKRNIGYMIIPQSRFTNTVKVSKQQIQTYYQQHQNDYKTPEKVSIEYVEITPKSIEAKIKPTPSELLSFYENNLSNYTTPARWHVAHILLNIPTNASPKQIDILKTKLDKVRTEAEKGASFAKLAAENSEDVLTAKEGGVMPWFSAGSLGPVFESTVAGLKPGQISEPVQTKYGVEIIKLLAVDKQKVKPYNSVAEQVKETYLNQKMQKQLADDNDNLSNITFENPNSLEPAVKQMQLKIQTTPLFTRKGTASGLTQNPNIIATAFSDGVLHQGNNSDVISLKDGTIVVLRVKQHIEANTKPLNEVSDTIKSILTQNAAEKAAQALGEKLLPEIKNSAQATQLALKNKLQWVTKVDVNRTTKGIPAPILVQAFNLHVPSKEQSIILQGLQMPNGDYAIVGVTKVTIANNAASEGKLAELLGMQVSRTMAQAEYNAYVKSAKDKAKIEHFDQNIL